ncbi:hypothetical protein GCM10019017_45830 [Streptomyces showdoensis]
MAWTAAWFAIAVDVALTGDATAAVPSAAKADPAPATSDAPRPAVARVATAAIRMLGFMTRFDIRG